MKLQAWDIIWGILVLFLLGVIAGITLGGYSNFASTPAGITEIIDSIIDARCIDTFDKNMLAIMERVCRKVVAHDPEFYTDELEYFYTWQNRRFAEHNDSMVWWLKNKEE